MGTNFDGSNLIYCSLFWGNGSSNLSMKKKRHISWILIFFCAASFLNAQEIVRLLDEKKLWETKWRYVKTVQTTSNVVVHQADSSYKAYLFFRLDHTFRQFVNGRTSSGKWQMRGINLDFPFRNATTFRVIRLDSAGLVLQFSDAELPSLFQYHFTNADNERTPFALQKGELPQVTVVAKKKPWWRFLFFWQKTDDAEPTAELPFISIELIGGGYYGGIDPVTKDYIQIKTDGRLIKEFQSQHQGLMVTKRTLPRTQLEQFVAFITQKGFFEFERLYDCQSESCQKRKWQKPTPVPLRLAVTHGNRRRNVTITIWGKEKNGILHVPHPPELDEIIDEIQRMAFE